MTEETKTEIAHVDDIDSTINKTISELTGKILDDRERAEMFYTEVLETFYSGNTSPQTMEQINKAQSMIQSSTDQMQKLLATVVKLKVGADKVQVAQISGNPQETIAAAKQSLIDIIDEMGAK